MRRRTKRTIVLLVVIAVLTFVGLTLTGNLPKGIKAKMDQILPVSVTKVIDKASNTVTDVLNGDEGLKKLQDVYQNWVDNSTATTTEVPDGLEIPKAVSGHQIVVHNGYTLSYNEKYEQPDWVAYVLTVGELNANNTSRTEDFREDPAVTTQSAHLDDYRNSGYDRGHLCPSADRTATVEENSETFYLSNMSPQIHRFNAGLWLKAEGAVRDAARQYGTLYVATGPVFSSNMKTIGDCSVAVPEKFYKVLLAVDGNGRVQMIGLVCPQEYENGNLKPYVCTVDEVERLTGLDFFPSLEDSVENQAEATYTLSAWPAVFSK